MISVKPRLITNAFSACNLQSEAITWLQRKTVKSGEKRIDTFLATVIYDTIYLYHKLHRPYLQYRYRNWLFNFRFGRRLRLCPHSLQLINHLYTLLYICIL